mmetsp:Transcript_32884/g.47588  ORF Transcript_32884/g.47588 Transcript_32884/m.47588 type:complete len:132 (-) Transcript_32884:195-590(-)
MKLSVGQLLLPLQLAILLRSVASFGINRSSMTSNNHRFVTSLSSEPLLESSVEDIEPPAPRVPCPNCDKCDGSGRIIGGLGAIELFSWWPIKAYRPCPNFIESGGQYVRSGQGLDEIAFGRDSSYDPNGSD